MNKALALIAGMLLCFFSFTTVQAARLRVDDGQLIGATGVDIEGELYDVNFVDGSCISIFDGCEDASDFTFDGTQALAASQALLDQVFQDTSEGLFDSSPDLTNGCTSTEYCYAYTPVSFFGPFVVVSIVALNAFPSAPADFQDQILQRGSTPEGDSGNAPDSVWAVWNPAPPVPVPAAAWLFGSALLGLFGFRKRKSSVPA